VLFIYLDSLPVCCGFFLLVTHGKPGGGYLGNISWCGPYLSRLAAASGSFADQEGIFLPTGLIGLALALPWNLSLALGNGSRPVGQLYGLYAFCAPGAVFHPARFLPLGRDIGGRMPGAWHSRSL